MTVNTIRTLVYLILWVGSIGASAMIALHEWVSALVVAGVAAAVACVAMLAKGKCDGD